MTDTNRHVRFDSYGDETVLQLVDEPLSEPGPGEVRVRVQYAGINPGEAKIRSGELDAMFPTSFPSGQGSDLAGVVEALGDGVEGLAVGQDVLGWTDDRAAHADTVVLPATQVVPRPAALDPVRAGALFVAGTTAWAAVDAVDPKAGETVVVSGAAGGVGVLAVQLARLRGARVIGLAGPANHDFLRSLGVEPIAYGDGLADRLRAAVPRPDALIDTHGSGYVDLAIELGVAPDRIDTVADFDAAARLPIKSAGNADGARPEVLAELADHLAWGRLVLPLAGIYPLAQVADAYRQLADGHTRGKIVLSTQDDEVRRPTS